jgi:hypothetical protein
VIRKRTARNVAKTRAMFPKKIRLKSHTAGRLEVLEGFLVKQG